MAHVAAEMGVSRPTAHKCRRRRQAEGVAGLVDRRHAQQQRRGKGVHGGTGQQDIAGVVQPDGQEVGRRQVVGRISPYASTRGPGTLRNANGSLGRPCCTNQACPVWPESMIVSKASMTASTVRIGVRMLSSASWMGAMMPV